MIDYKKKYLKYKKKYISLSNTLKGGSINTLPPTPTLTIEDCLVEENLNLEDSIKKKNNISEINNNKIKYDNTCIIESISKYKSKYETYLTRLSEQPISEQPISKSDKIKEYLKSQISLINDTIINIENYDDNNTEKLNDLFNTFNCTDALLTNENISTNYKDFYIDRLQNDEIFFKDYLIFTLLPVVTKEYNSSSIKIKHDKIKKKKEECEKSYDIILNEGHKQRYANKIWNEAQKAAALNKKLDNMARNMPGKGVFKNIIDIIYVPKGPILGPEPSVTIDSNTLDKYVSKIIECNTTIVIYNNLDKKITDLIKIIQTFLLWLKNFNINDDKYNYFKKDYSNTYNVNKDTLRYRNQMINEYQESRNKILTAVHDINIDIANHFYNQGFTLPIITYNIDILVTIPHYKSQQQNVSYERIIYDYDMGGNYR